MVGGVGNVGALAALGGLHQLLDGRVQRAPPERPVEAGQHHVGGVFQRSQPGAVLEHDHAGQAARAMPGGEGAYQSAGDGGVLPGWRPSEMRRESEKMSRRALVLLFGTCSRSGSRPRAR